MATMIVQTADFYFLLVVFMTAHCAVVLPARKRTISSTRKSGYQNLTPYRRDDPRRDHVKDGIRRTKKSDSAF